MTTILIACDGESSRDGLHRLQAGLFSTIPITIKKTALEEISTESRRHSPAAHGHSTESRRYSTVWREDSMAVREDSTEWRHHSMDWREDAKESRRDSTESRHHSTEG